jgi:hypothetical protein
MGILADMGDVDSYSVKVAEDNSFFIAHISPENVDFEKLMKIYNELYPILLSKYNLKELHVITPSVYCANTKVAIVMFSIYRYIHNYDYSLPNLKIKQFLQFHISDNIYNIIDIMLRLLDDK